MTVWQHYLENIKVVKPSPMSPPPAPLPGEEI
jgi:hypothetical protein